MKSIKGIFIGLGLFALPVILHAQTADISSASIAPEPVSDTQVMLQAVESTTPISFATLPRTQRFGTFWSAQHAPGSREQWPPLPGNAMNLPVWSLGDGTYLVDDRNVDYVGIRAEVEAEAVLAATVSPMLRMSMMASSLSSSYAYGNPVYLTNLTAIASGYGNMTASFSIAGGTNFVPYDILTTTNLATPRENWNWLGLGYTSNNYTFNNQSGDQAFYLLAKPAKTMTVGFGDDSLTQCDLPNGLTNVLQAAAGGGHSLALKSDGTVVAWGWDIFGQATVPTTLTNVSMVAAGWYHSVALSTNGNVTAWGWNTAAYDLTVVPSNLTNAIIISAHALHSLAVRRDGTVVGWGYNNSGETTPPVGLSNVVAISAGYMHSLAVTTNGNGTVVAWGYHGDGQCDVPPGLSNVVDVAAGICHSLALKSDGTVVAWGKNYFGETNVPVGLSNVVAIAAGGDLGANGLPATPISMALKSDGTVVAWGYSPAVDPVGGLANVIAISAGEAHALAIRTGPPTPVVTLEPVDQYKIAGGTAAFSVRGQGLYGVTYQWQTNGVNLSGATNTTLTLTNVQTAQQAAYRAVITDLAGNGSIASSNAVLSLVTPPVIVSQSPMPTNQVLGVAYQTNLTLSVVATAPGMNNGFPLHYQWQKNGTNISSRNAAAYNFTVVVGSADRYSVIVTNALGSVSAGWQITVTNAINVTNDLLLIYNANSTDSSNLCAYYLAHRQMVGGANVLPVTCDVGEFTTSTNCNAQIMAPVLNWLTNNPAKRPQYVILFYDIPTRLTNLFGADYGTYGSVDYHLHFLRPDWQPFVNRINAGSLADCEAYVNKLAAFGSNYCPGQIIISASAGLYGNTNFVLDNVRHGLGYGDDFTIYGSRIYGAISAITNASSSAGITYIDGVETTNVLFLPHITNAMNVAGYICWGGHSNWGTNNNDGNYALDGNVKWSGNSGWWIIKTLESYNGKRITDQGNFVKWFSSNAFGGTNYSNTPIGGTSNVEEPYLESNYSISTYFSLWAAGNNLGICAWQSWNTSYFQVLGDPFVTR